MSLLKQLETDICSGGIPYRVESNSSVSPACTPYETQPGGGGQSVGGMGVSVGCGVSVISPGCGRPGVEVIVGVEVYWEMPSADAIESAPRTMALDASAITNPAASWRKKFIIRQLPRLGMGVRGGEH